MNKHAAFSSLIIQITGGVIIVVLIMVMFSGFASPFLEFLADSENIKSFNKLTSGVSDACRNTISTNSYFGFTSAGLDKNYIVAVVGPETHKVLEFLETSASENHDNSDKPYVNKYAYSATEKCTDGDYCLCLLRIQYNQQNNEEPFCPGIDLTAVVVPESGRIHYYMDGTFAYRIYIENTNSYRAAQAFVPEQDKSIDTVYIKGKYQEPKNPKPLTLSVYNAASGNPSASLASATVTPSELYADWIEFKFDSEVSLKEGKTYYIVVNSSSEGNPFLWYGTPSTQEYDTLKTQRHLGENRFSVSESWHDKGMPSGLPHTPNPTITIFSFSIPEKMDGSAPAYAVWDKDFAKTMFQKNEQTNNYPVKQARFIQCRALKSNLGCENKDNNLISPMVNIDNENYFLVWLQPEMSKKQIISGIPVPTLYHVPKSLWFDSLTISQPFNEKGELENYTLVYSEPSLIPEIHIIGNTPTIGKCEAQ